MRPASGENSGGSQLNGQEVEQQKRRERSQSVGKGGSCLPSATVAPHWEWDGSFPCDPSYSPPASATADPSRDAFTAFCQCLRFRTQASRGLDIAQEFRPAPAWRDNDRATRRARP